MENISSEKVLTSDKLKEIFPQYINEIEELKRGACGCGGCVWNILKEKHKELTLPKDNKFIWVV